MGQWAIVGIDLGKTSFQLCATDDSGHVVEGRKLNRNELRHLAAAIPPCLIAMEACGTAYHWARVFQRFGHRVRLISPQYVKPFVRTNKNDRNDAHAIVVAASRPGMPSVPVKNVEQQDIQMLHRVRSRRVAERTALINQTRGLLLEYGIAIPLGPGAVRVKLPEILEDAENELSGRGRRVIAELLDALRLVDELIRVADRQIREVFRASEACRRLADIDGIGLLTATALVAAIGDGKDFHNGRHLAAWLGLVPRQHSTGGRSRLLGISRRGDTHLRTLFIHGARSALRIAHRRSDRRMQWACEIERRRGPNVAVVALANKTARIAWAMLRHDEAFRRVQVEAIEQV
jgi:transposase